MFELFPLAAALSGGSVAKEVALAVLFNVAGAVACVGGLRCALLAVPSHDLPESLTAWPWEPAAWGCGGKRKKSSDFPSAADEEQQEAAIGECDSDKVA